MTRVRVLIVACLAAVGLSAGTASAGFVLQPSAATSQIGTADGSPNATRNQTGLTPGYTSGVTDFATYLAGNPTHNNGGGGYWVSGVGNTTGDFDFALGGSYYVRGFALWGLGTTDAANIKTFDLLADDNAAFSSPTALGSFIATPGGTFAAAQPDVFTFTEVLAGYIRVRITGNQDPTFPVVGFGEGAFDASLTPTAVPEPSSAALLGVAAAGLGIRRLRRRAGR